MRLVHLSSRAAALAVCLASVSPAAAQEPAAAAGTADIYLPEGESVPPPVVVGPGKLTEKYANGTVRIEREVLKLSDNQIVNNGVFSEFFSNGQKFAEGHYVNGVHDGQWSFWHDNGQLCKTVTFKNGRADGTWEVFRADGSLQAKRTYKDNLRDGMWITYYDDGKTVKVEDSYTIGKHEGVSRVFFDNGKPQREMTFKDGELEGVMTEWDQSGRKLAEVGFKAGKRDGKWIMYRADGTTVEQTYTAGRLVPEAAGG